MCGCGVWNTSVSLVIPFTEKTTILEFIVLLVSASLKYSMCIRKIL